MESCTQHICKGANRRQWVLFMMCPLMSVIHVSFSQLTMSQVGCEKEMQGRDERTEEPQMFTIDYQRTLALSFMG